VGHILVGIFDITSLFSVGSDQGKSNFKSSLIHVLDRWNVWNYRNDWNCASVGTIGATGTNGTASLRIYVELLPSINLGPELVEGNLEPSTDTVRDAWNVWNVRNRWNGPVSVVRYPGVVLIGHEHLTVTTMLTKESVEVKV
jgi:hypothetical protein